MDKDKLKRLDVADYTENSGIIEEHVNSTKQLDEHIIDSLVKDKKLVIPEGIESIDKKAFSKYKYKFFFKFESVEIPSSLTKIEELALLRYKVKEFVVAENNPLYKSINGCIYNKDGTELIYSPLSEDFVIPKSVRKIRSHAIFDDNVQVSFEDYDSIEEIGAGFFTPYDKSVVLPKNLKSIPQRMFFMCTNLEKIVIPDTVTKIGSVAFQGCRKLKSITIPASVTELDFSFYNSSPFFDSCLEEVIVDENNPNYKSVDGVLFSKDGKKLLYYPCRKRGSTYTIPEGVEEVNEYAFFHYMSEDYLLDVNIPKTVHLKDTEFMNDVENSGEEDRDTWEDGYFFTKSGDLIDKDELNIIKKYYLNISDEEDDESCYEDPLEADLSEVFAAVKAKADEGDKEAYWALAKLYLDGIGVEKNPEQADKYLKRYKESK